MVVARGGDAPPDVTQVTLTRPLENALATVLGRRAHPLAHHPRRGRAVAAVRARHRHVARAAAGRVARRRGARRRCRATTEVVVERLTTTSFPVVTFNLTGAVDPRRLRELGELVLRPALSRVRGVGRVEVLGGDVREVEVILDPGARPRRCA